MSLLGIFYLFAALWLSVYGLNAFVLIFLYLKHRRERVECPPLTLFPLVTVQLPVYNEKYVVKRAIDSLARLDWPADRLQIQVLDDSTDETTDIAGQCVKACREQGLDIVLLHRTERTGFKAGALNEALSSARGEFVALFDADFEPAADFIKRTLPYLVADPALGFVQTRWGHLNDEYSLFALAQAIALDGHFSIEHVARQRAGLLTGFNGTSGVWRRRAIEESGGWDPAMLTEDIDLSFRAQLAGWKGLMLADVVSPAELPVQLAAFKSQQFRWAKGNVRCCLKLFKGLVSAPIPPWTRVQGLIYLSYYLAHPLMLLVLLCSLPLAWFDLISRFSLAFLGLATLGPPLIYALGQRAIDPEGWRRLRALPVLICLGTGLALSNSVAVVEAALGIRSAFQRTPKFQIEGKRGEVPSPAYSVAVGPLVWGELLLAFYSALTIYAAFVKGYWPMIPFILLYLMGFGYVSIMALCQSARQMRPSGQQALCSEVGRA